VRAVVIYGKEDFRYEEVADPKPGEEQVAVKVGRCGGESERPYRGSGEDRPDHNP